MFLGLKLESWSDAGGLIGVVALFAALIALWQLVEMRSTRKREALSYALDRLGNLEARRDRETLYSLKDLPKGAPISKDQRDAVERVCVLLDTVGSMVKLKLIPKKELLTYHSEFIVRAWSEAEDFAKEHQATYGGERGDCFAWLAKEAQKVRGASPEYSALHVRGQAK